MASPSSRVESARRRGGVMIEFSLLLPLLVSLFLGVVFFGNDLYLYN